MWALRVRLSSSSIGRCGAAGGTAGGATGAETGRAAIAAAVGPENGCRDGYRSRNGRTRHGWGIPHRRRHHRWRHLHHGLRRHRGHCRGPRHRRPHRGRGTGHGHRTLHAVTRMDCVHASLRSKLRPLRSKLRPLRSKLRRWGPNCRGPPGGGGAATDSSPRRARPSSNCPS